MTSCSSSSTSNHSQQRNITHPPAYDTILAPPIYHSNSQNHLQQPLLSNSTTQYHTIHHERLPSYKSIDPRDAVRVGACPVHQEGQHTPIEEFTCLGIFCGIFFFPVGLICCFLLRERKCFYCGFEF